MFQTCIGDSSSCSLPGEFPKSLFQALSQFKISGVLAGALGPARHGLISVLVPAWSGLARSPPSPSSCQCQMSSVIQPGSAHHHSQLSTQISGCCSPTDEPTSVYRICSQIRFSQVLVSAAGQLSMETNHLIHFSLFLGSSILISSPDVHAFFTTM